MTGDFEYIPDPKMGPFDPGLWPVAWFSGMESGLPSFLVAGSFQYREIVRATRPNVAKLMDAADRASRAWKAGIDR